MVAEAIPLIINVATLLREPIGSSREYRVHSETAEVPEAAYSREISGRVHLLRTARGVLLRARLAVRPPLECARCLDLFEGEADLEIEEMFVFERDPITLKPVEIAADEFRLVDDQYLDVSEAVRQYEETAVPISPICRDACAGLCPVCGKNRNRDVCDCVPAPEIVPAWGNLAALADRLRSEETEESDGRSKA
jgi:uncharacterized protein